MDPSRKRRIRLVIALTAAMLLAGALIYTSFSAATDAKQPSQLLRSADSGRSYELTGKVVAGSIVHNGDSMRFSVRDRNGTGTPLRVSYSGEVPDPFRAGREIIVKGTMRGGTFVGERDSLVTKCPSKFQAAPNTSKT
ncbi:MAG TPA: cytochrome c maturation protein CcmE [Thermoleophilaceae bacterium]|nr:cytochrome c maturation protein CcmE [Thermoleophilaceae bacterium]